MPLASRPDAIRWPIAPGTMPVGQEHRRAIDARVDFAEQHLQAGPTEMVYVRDIAFGQYHFATREPTDAEFERVTRKPRYRWENKGSGLLYGYLIDG
jgi:hypothetical protein